MGSQRILVVDDDLAVQSVLERILTREHFKVSKALSGQDGLRVVHAEKPDLLILDLNLPDVSGEEVCALIRKDKSVRSVPVLILTGRCTDGLSTKCLDGGADDYVSKPFDIQELVARVRALLRRPAIYASDDSIITKGNIEIHVAERRVSVNGKTVEKLAPKEFALLKQLVLHGPKVLDKNTLALSAWGLSAERLHHRTLDVHVRRIRRKIGPVASKSLKTIPAVGYQWADHGSAAT